MSGNYFVYILRCQDGSLYTGITTDVQRRFEEHCGRRAGRAKYTRSRHPLCIERVWQTTDRPLASRLEYRIKTLTKAQKEQLIRDPALLAVFLGDTLDLSAYTVVDY